MDKYKPKTFRELLKKTHKYKDLYTTIDGVLSLIIGIIFSAFFVCYLHLKSVDEINSMLKEIALTFIPCLISYLGFVISGLAFVSGTISLKATENIFKQEKIEYLESIFFTFHFLGMITGIDIVFFAIILLAALSNVCINYTFVFIFTTFVAYLTFFIVFYSIGLLDTCIKIFFVNYKFNKEDKSTSNQNDEE